VVNALYAVPAWLLLTLACATAVLLAVGGQIWVHTRFSRVNFIQHNEVGGFTIAVVGTLYAVIVAFIVAIDWQEYDGSASRLATEAAAGMTVYHVAAGLPEPIRSRMRSTIVGFARDMLDQEWPRMRTGGSSPRGEALITDALHEISQFRPQNLGESNVQSLIVQRVQDVHELRHQRLFDNSAGISWFEWLILFFGAFLVVGFFYLFGVQSQSVHRIMAAVVACMIAASFVLIFELDYPFRGDLAISPGPWAEFLRAIGA
jgi:Protein of unknown function (DUF4239)